MKKKIFIGSIVAVIILILVSFSGVVGYQTTKSFTNAKASPLFNIRSSKAIGRESKEIACDYVGKGEESVLSIPKRNDRTALVQKFIDMISKMKDKIFTQFIGVTINRMKQNGHTEIENADIVNTLSQLRTNQDVEGVLLVDSENTEDVSFGDPCTVNNWEIGCLLSKLFTILVLIIFYILYPLPSCYPITGGCYTL